MSSSPSAPRQRACPIWATVGHTAGMRVYWLCEVVGEPGAEATPFTIPLTVGWEDDLSHPRNAAELVGALDTTFAVIEGVLDRWTPDLLTLEVRREYGGQVWSTAAARSCSASSPTRRTTAASCRRRWGSTACRRSISGRREVDPHHRPAGRGPVDLGHAGRRIDGSAADQHLARGDPFARLGEHRIGLQRAGPATAGEFHGRLRQRVADALAPVPGSREYAGHRPDAVVGLVLVAPTHGVRKTRSSPA